MAKSIGSNEEPNTAPEPDRWYGLTLGSSFKDQQNHNSPKFRTLRYEFKPASIDKSQPGSLHKSKGNKITVDHHNNQPGKPKVTFEGVSEDYKENDAVLFFDGETFRLEQLHHAVKRLRHVRLTGESAASVAAGTVAVVLPVETYSLPVGKGTNVQSLNKGIAHQIPVQVEQIGVGDSESLEPKDEKIVEHPSFPPNPSAMSPNPKNSESEEQIDIINDDDDGFGMANRGNATEKQSHTALDIDINLPHQADTDDEIADVDISDDEADKGPNAAEALRAQVNTEGWKEQTSSSSSSGRSDSSGSGSGSQSGSSSSDSESSEVTRLSLFEQSSAYYIEPEFSEPG